MAGAVDGTLFGVTDGILAGVTEGILAGCKGITPYMTVCSLVTLTTKHSIICLYIVL